MHGQISKILAQCVLNVVYFLTTTTNFQLFRFRFPLQFSVSAFRFRTLFYGGREGHSESAWHTPGPGLRIQQHRTPDPGIYGSALRDQQYRSPDELKWAWPRLSLSVSPPIVVSARKINGSLHCDTENYRLIINF